MANFETSENLPKYFRSIQTSTPLSIAAEGELATRIKAGDESAIHELVSHNLKIVVTIANRHIGQGVPIDDLIQEGNIALLEAARRFSPTNNTRFISYATLWIRKYLNEKVVEHGRIVRLPHNQEYDRYKAKVAGLEVANLASVAIDAPVGDDNKNTIGDIILNDRSEIEYAIEHDHVQYTVTRVLGVLKPRDKDIVSAYFGIGIDEALPTSQIAEQFDMTQARVSQIIKSALTKMKHII